MAAWVCGPVWHINDGPQFRVNLRGTRAHELFLIIYSNNRAELEHGPDQDIGSGERSGRGRRQETPEEGAVLSRFQLNLRPTHQPFSRHIELLLSLQQQLNLLCSFVRAWRRIDQVVAPAPDL